MIGQMIGALPMLLDTCHDASVTWLQRLVKAYTTSHLRPVKVHSIHPWRLSTCMLAACTTSTDTYVLTAADKTFADTVGDCPLPNATVPKYQPGGFCPVYPYAGTSLAGANNGFCATAQPTWSAFREPTYGHGVMTFMNSTTALWQWNRNIDNEAVIGDSVYIIRQMTCANKASFATSAPPTAGTLTATSG